METIKSFEDACNKVGIDPAALPNVSMLPEQMQNALVAQYKLWVIAKALNDGWEPDWTNDDEYKYYPWFYMQDGSSGLGFSDPGFDDDYAGTAVGSRLCFKSSELARYAGKTFLELYRQVFVL